MRWELPLSDGSETQLHAIGQLFRPAAKVHDILFLTVSSNPSCPDLLKTESLDQLRPHYNDKKTEEPLNPVVCTSDMGGKNCEAQARKKPMENFLLN